MNDRPPASRAANSCLGPGRSYVTDPGTVHPMSRRTVSRIFHRVDIGFEYTKIGRQLQFLGPSLLGVSWPMMEGMYGMTLCPRPRCVYPSPTGRTIPASLMPPPSSDSPRLLDRVRTTCRRRGYSLHTERAYVRWIVRFVRFHDTTHPRLLDAADVRGFLNHRRYCGLWVARFGLWVSG
jgi:hypothetical protein